MTHFIIVVSYRFPVQIVFLLEHTGGQLKGEINSPIDPEPGCRFAKRCPYAKHCCKEPVPLQEVEPGHFVACHRVREINSL